MRPCPPRLAKAPLPCQCLASVPASLGQGPLAGPLQSAPKKKAASAAFFDKQLMSLLLLVLNHKLFANASRTATHSHGVVTGRQIREVE